jgi:hypothetical protein
VEATLGKISHSARPSIIRYQLKNVHHRGMASLRDPDKSLSVGTTLLHSHSSTQNLIRRRAKGNGGGGGFFYESIWSKTLTKVLEQMLPALPAAYQQPGINCATEYAGTVFGKYPVLRRRDVR